MASTNLDAIDGRAIVSLIYGLNSTLIAISTVCLVLRLYTRAFIVRALGSDDAMAVVALVSIYPLDISSRLLTRSLKALCVFQSSMDMYCKSSCPKVEAEN